MNNTPQSTTGFAYYDNKIHDPKTPDECAMLTLQIVTNE